MLAVSSHAEASEDGKRIEKKKINKDQKNTKNDLSKLGDIPAVQRATSGTYSEKWTILICMIKFKEMPQSRLEPWD